MSEKNWEKLAPSFSLEDERLASLKQIVPEAFTDGKIDFDALKELLGEVVEDESAEHFGLNWTGKREARRLAGMPSKGTLVPVPGKGLHEDTTENIFIEGDNLEVLKLLHKSYRGKIKMIYIDPPYNTGNDFIYKDDYRMPLESYLQRSGQKSDMGELLTSNPKSSGRFHSDWLNMMYPRLRVAKDLLREDGVIFVSIDDNELHNLRQALNELFGEENFRNCFALRRYDKNLNRQFIENGLKSFNVGFEYVVCYSFSDKFAFDPVYKASSEDRQNFGYWKGFWNGADRPTMRYEILGFTPTEGQWKWSQEKALKGVENYKTYVEKHSLTKTLEEYWIETGRTLGFIRRNPNGKGKNKGVDHWIPPSDGILRNTNWTDTFASKSEEEIGGYFDFSKNIEALRNLVIAAGVESEDIILDFFAGSGSTAHAIMDLNASDGGNRRYICIQLDEKVAENSEAYNDGFRAISDICAERLRQVSNGLKGSDGSDIGFRFHRLESSKFKAWSDYQGNDLDELRGLLQAQLDSTFVDGASEDAILTEILLLEGFPLTSKIEIDETFQKNAVRRTSHQWSEHRLFVTLDKEIQEETIRTVDQMIDSDEMSKLDIFICLDNALTDQDKLRLADVCRLKTI